jgi:small-conductance mechanosensitive channel
MARMFAADSGIEVGDWISAGVAILIAFVVATLVDRAFRSKAAREVTERTGISPASATRLRFVRRLVYAVIVLIGLAIAVSGFPGVQSVARSLLASGAIAAAIIGFAARQTLANFVAGVMLAITQPLRVGDWVTFEDHHGVVEDVRLNYTVLRIAGETRMVIPNERLASGILQNDTLVVDTVGLDVAIWIPPAADAGHAVALLREESGGEVTVAEVSPWGVRLAVGGQPGPAAQRGEREADLRAQCHARLRAEGLLEGFSAPDRS